MNAALCVNECRAQPEQKKGFLCNARNPRYLDLGAANMETVRHALVVLRSAHIRLLNDDDAKITMFQKT